MEEKPKPRRRWFRFSLRTMLVLVTLICILCGYVGWAMKWIEKREAYRRSVINRTVFQRLEYHPAPWSLQLLQEKGVSHVCLLNPDAAELDAASRLFPEAKFIFAEIKENGVTYRARLNYSSPNSMWNETPYYQNGVRYRGELLERESKMKSDQLHPATQDYP